MLGGWGRFWPRQPAATMDLEHIRAIAERVANSEGLEVFDVEWKGGSKRPLLRIYIDKPEGISHRDCELVSQQVGTILDVEDLVPSSYVLEVSSPGLEAKLSRPAHYEHFKGRLARIVLHEPVENQRVLEGRLLGLVNEKIGLQLADDRVVELAFAQIARAHLIVEF